MTAILGATVPADAERALKAEGYRTLRIPPHPQLPFPVNSHPDMLLFFSSDAIFCTATYFKVARRELEELSHVAKLPIRTVTREVGQRYPEDVLLNAAPVGKYLFCRPDATAEELLTQPDVTVLPVKQGYAKCSVIPVGKSALMTADASIGNTAAKAGLDVLSLPTNGICLEGYAHGFPGGCTSFSPYRHTDKIYFCGSLSQYAGSADMHRFCANRGIQLLSLGDFPPTDVGTIFLIESKR
jgi:hypothetical protein